VDESSSVQSVRNARKPRLYIPIDRKALRTANGADVVIWQIYILQMRLFPEFSGPDISGPQSYLPVRTSQSLTMAIAAAT
jgi:hypothetical protein